MRVLVIGGTLFIGRHLVDALLRAGHDVAVLHRNPQSPLPHGVRSLVADRNDAASVRIAIVGLRFDAVFDNVYDWERGTTAEQVVSTAQACGDVQRYVFMSSVAAYGDGLGHLESDELAADDHPESYVRNKAASERALFAMRDFPVVTLRPPFIYGPGNPFYREAFFWDRLRDRRPIIVPGDGSRLMQFVYVHDIVRCCLRVLDVPAAIGNAFNVCDEKPLTQLEAVRAVARAASIEPGIRYLPRQKALDAGGNPMGPKLYFAMYYDMPPITMNSGGVRRILGIEPTPFDEGLRTTYQWWREHNLFPAPDYAFEDSLLAG